VACNLKQKSRRKLKCQRHAVTQTEDTDITCPSSLADAIKLRPWVETNLCVADVKKTTPYTAGSKISTYLVMSGKVKK